MDSIPHIERTINNEYYPRMPGRRASVEERREQILSAAFKVACRNRLKGLTIRATAAEAGLSAGLVLYHFKSRDGLLVALLDWLLLTTIVGVPTPEILALPTAKERLLGLMRIELELLPERLQRLELFVDYWVLGIGHPLIRRRIRRALRRYRNAILSLAKVVIEELRGDGVHEMLTMLTEIPSRNERVASLRHAQSARPQPPCFRSIHTHFP